MNINALLKGLEMTARLETAIATVATVVNNLTEENKNKKRTNCLAEDGKKEIVKTSHPLLKKRGVFLCLILKYNHRVEKF